MTSNREDTIECKKHSLYKLRNCSKLVNNKLTIYNVLVQFKILRVYITVKIKGMVHGLLKAFVVSEQRRLHEINIGSLEPPLPYFKLPSLSWLGGAQNPPWPPSLSRSRQLAARGGNVAWPAPPHKGSPPVWPTKCGRVGPSHTRSGCSFHLVTRIRGNLRA